MIPAFTMLSAQGDRQRPPGSLSDAEIIGSWEAVPWDDFSFDSLLFAARSVMPDLPATTDREALAQLLETSALKLECCRWPDGLRGVAVWRGRGIAPPADALRAAYNFARMALLKRIEPEGRA